VVLPAGWRGAPFPGSSANSAYKYLARAPQTLGVRGTFLAGLASIPKGLTLEQVFFSGSSAAWRYVGRTQAVTINGAPGIYYHSTKAVVAGSEAILTDVWAFDRHGQMFFFIFEGPASLSSEYNPVFAQSAATIHFSATSGTTSA
jgi:hypothetical protein